MDDGVGSGLMFGVGAAYGLLMAPPFLKALAPPKQRQTVIICLNCSAKNPDVNRYCGNCGEPLYPSIDCRVCGKKMFKEWSYCGNCGSALRKKAKKGQKG